MAESSPARWLAPLALLGTLAAILFVISSSGGSSSTPSATGGDGSAVTGSTTTGEDEGAETTTTTGERGTGKGPRRYTVQSGDTLSAIADKTGVPLETIEELNPDVDAQTLTAGQRIKLRP